MNEGTRTLMAIGAGLAWLAALGAEWMTIHGATIQLEGFEDHSGMRHLASPSGIPVSANSGTVSLVGVPLDIWIIVAAGGVGSLLAGLRAVGKAALPRLVPLALVVIATLYVGSAWIAALDSDVSLGPGLIAASTGSILGCLLAFASSANGATRASA